MLVKNPVTPPGIDPGTVRLVAQRLNQYATPGTNSLHNISLNLGTFVYCSLSLSSVKVRKKVQTVQNKVLNNLFRVSSKVEFEKWTKL
jgi:hypothetical protein